MKELQSEIGLSIEEANLVIFTSLDLDWMNNMLVLASEFTKWFSINF